MASLEFSVSPNKKGDVYATTFTFTKTTLPSYLNTTWDFGDGNFAYNSNKVSHVYNYPGIYTVALSAWSPVGELVVAYDFIDVDYIYRDAITITNLPKTWDVPGVVSEEPFFVSLTSAKINEPLSIVLHSLNSKSLPYDVSTSKWNFLNPRWRFIDAQTNQVVKGPIQLSSAPIYKDGIVVAVSSLAAFFYVDDSPTLVEEASCPVIVIATLSTENFSYPPESLVYPYYSYSNNETVQAATIWQTKNPIPTHLKVTENYYNDIYYYKWTGVPIPVMLTCSFDPAKLDTYGFVNNVSQTDLFSYPKINAYGLRNAVDLKLEGYAPSEYKVDDAPLYFQRLDENGLPIGGYIFTTITPLVSSKGTTTFITASTVATHNLQSTDNFMFPYAYPIDPIAYVAHPYQNNINKIQLAYYDSSCGIAKSYKDKGFLADGFINCINVPALYVTDTSNLEISGASNIYGLTYNPITRTLYGADADRNTICSINANEQITNITEISAVTQRIYDTPSYISIDRNFNVWVSLYDSATVIKYSPDLQTVLASATPVLSAYDILDEEGNPMIEPSVVETDRNNDVWVCYSHPLSSLLVKYSSSGVQLTGYNLGYNKVPTSLAIDISNNVWVASYNGSKLECFNTQGKLLSSYDFLKPSYIAIDRQNNVWVAHGYNLCSVLNTKTSAVSSWQVDTTTKTKKILFDQYTPLSGYPSSFVQQTIALNEIWGGIAIDVFDRVWLVDSENNNIGVFSTSTVNEFNVFGVAPKVSKNFIIKGNDDFTSEIPATVARSAQANGDWTGNRWYQKYATEYLTTNISGSSTPFLINNLDTVFTVAKVNDDFNCGAYMKSLALPEILNQNREFFDKFLPAVVGSGDVTKQDLGRTSYERIANFVTNHSDVDTAEIPQLHSLADEVGVPTKRYGVEFPGEVNYYLSLFSVPRKQLMGTEKLDPDFENTIGPLINFTDSISAGQYIYAKDRRYSNYQLIFTTRTSAQNLVYPLSALDVDGLREPLHENYYFFEFQPKLLGYTSNVVDWNSTYTTIPRSLSSDEIWYGEDQTVELYFNNLLTKRLFSK
jgi:hypothetical protein